MATQQFKISKVNVDLSKYTLTSSIANDYTRNDEIEENWYRKEYVASNYTANSIVADNYYSKDYVNTNYKSNADVDNNYFTKTYVATNYYLKNDIDSIQLDIKNAINNKGGTLTNEPFSSYAAAINNLTISSGGGTSGGSSESSDSIDVFLSNTQMSFTYNGGSIARYCQLYNGTSDDTSSPVINMPNITELPILGSTSSKTLLRYFPYTGTLNIPSITELPNYFSYCLFNQPNVSEESLNTSFTKLNSLVANITSLGEYSLWKSLGGKSYNLVDNIATDVLTRDIVLSFPKVNTIKGHCLSYCGISNDVPNNSGPYSGMKTNGFKISLPALTNASTSMCFSGLICGILSAPNAKVNIENSNSNVFGYATFDSYTSNENTTTHTIDINRLYCSSSGRYQDSYYVFAGWNNLQTLVIRGNYAPYTGFVNSSSDSSQRIFSPYCYCMLGKVDSIYNPNGVKGRIYVNSSRVNEYKSAPGWSEFADQIYPLPQYDEATRYSDSNDITYTYTDDSYIVLKPANGGYVSTLYKPTDMENTKIELKFEYVDYVYGNGGLFGSKYYASDSEGVYNGVYYEAKDPDVGKARITTGQAMCVEQQVSNYITANTPNILTIIGGESPVLNGNSLVPDITYTNYPIKYSLGIGAILGSKTSSDGVTGTTVISANNGSLKFYYMKIYTRANTTSDWTLIKDYRPRVGRGIVETISDTTLYNFNGETPLDNSNYNGGFGNV